MPITENDLYRAIINGSMDGPFVVDQKPVAGLLYPRFEDSSYIDAKGVEQTSRADVKYLPNPDTGVSEVQPKGGTSMFDVSGWFGTGNWRYFHVPEGTQYHESLFIKRGKSVRTNRSGTLKGRHYQIEPKLPMTVDAFKGALDNFARAAVVKQLANAAG